MIVYSIKDLEKLSGIKAHTLRIWEKRYAILMPKRTDTNIRYYEDADLQKVLNIALLRKKGYKISKIAALTESDITRLTAELSEVDVAFEDHIDALTMAMFELNEYKFNKILDHYIDQNGFAHTMEEVIYPFLEKLSMMWMAGSIKSAHESFITYFIRRKCIAAIDNIKHSHYDQGPSFVIYLAEKETHELSLLYIHYLLKKQGVEVINLGMSVPLIDLVDTCNIKKPDYIFTMINDSYSHGTLQGYLDDILKYSNNSKLVISGYQTVANKIESHERLLQLNSIEEIKLLIDEITTEYNN